MKAGKVIIVCLRLFIIASLTSVLLIAGVTIWIKSTWTDLISEKKMVDLTKEVESAEPLPEEFNRILTSLYPNVYDNNSTLHFFKHSILKGIYKYEPCPCSLLAKTLETSPPEYEYAGRIAITWEIENRLTQKSCFSYYLQHFDFTNGVIGVRTASQQYFSKDFESLHTDEYLQLVLKISNPLFYQKDRNPESYKRTLDMLRNRYLKNASSVIVQ